MFAVCSKIDFNKILELKTFPGKHFITPIKRFWKIVLKRSFQKSLFQNITARTFCTIVVVIISYTPGTGPENV